MRRALPIVWLLLAGWLGAAAAEGGKEAASRVSETCKTRGQDPCWLALNEPGGGSLWRWSAGKARLVNRWNFDEPPLRAIPSPAGRLFGFVGGQTVTGGAVDSAGIQLRLGSTLFHDRYDVALSYGYNKMYSDPKYEVATFGLVGRVRFPLTRRFGGNVGLQVQRSVSTQGQRDALSGLAGINFYLPTGSFDITLNVGNHDTYGLLAGFTLYLPSGQ